MVYRINISARTAAYSRSFGVVSSLDSTSIQKLFESVTSYRVTISRKINHHKMMPLEEALKFAKTLVFRKLVTISEEQIFFRELESFWYKRPFELCWGDPAYGVTFFHVKDGDPYDWQDAIQELLPDRYVYMSAIEHPYVLGHLAWIKKEPNKWILAEKQIKNVIKEKYITLK